MNSSSSSSATSFASAAVAKLIAQFPVEEDGKLSGISEEKLLEAIIALQSQSQKPRKSKSTKDPNKPKRGRSAYILWLSDNRSRIKEALGADTDSDVKPTEVVKEGGRQWKLLKDDEKVPFETQALLEKERYASEMEIYKPSDSVVIYTIDEYPSAPSDWSGPFQMKYLSKNARSLEGKPLSFKKFDEAIEAASKIDGCGGITKTARGYSLRVGPDLISTPAASASGGLASWIKGTPETFVQMTETKVETLKKPKVVKIDTAEETDEGDSEDEDEEVEPPKSKSKSKPKTRSSTKKSSKSKVSDMVDSEDEEVEEVVEPPKQTKKSSKKKTFKPTKVPEPEPEPEVVTESESEEDEDLDVEEVVIDGEKYFKTEDGKLYDPDTQEVVGENGTLYE